MFRKVCATSFFTQIEDTLGELFFLTTGEAGACFLGTCDVKVDLDFGTFLTKLFGELLGLKERLLS